MFLLSLVWPITPQPVLSLWSVPTLSSARPYGQGINPGVGPSSFCFCHGYVLALNLLLHPNVLAVSPAADCVFFCFAPGPDPVVSVTVTVTNPSTVSTAPVSVIVRASTASAPGKNRAGTVIY